MPEHQQTIHFQDRTDQDLLSITYGAFEQLNWTLKYAGDNIIVAYTPRTWKRYDNEVSVEVNNGNVSVTSKMIHGEAFDMSGRTKKDVNNFVAAFDKTAVANETQLAVWNGKIIDLRASTIVEVEQEVQRAVETDKIMNFSTGNMYLTYSIMAINVVVFVLMAVGGVNVFEPLTLDIIRWGGNFPALTFGGEWWRLISCVFVHIGVLHLLLNMYALYSVGVYLEPMLGKLRFAAAYVCTGLLSSLISVWWNREDGITSAGASGAIFGMYGVFLALLTTNIIPKHIKNSILSSILIFVGYNIFYGFRPNSGIDNAAHIGGLLSGMVIGYLFFLTFKAPSAKKSQTITGLVALATIMIVFMVLREQKTEPIKLNYQTGEIKEDNLFQQKMERFAQLETTALEPQSDTTQSVEELIRKFREISLPAWKEAASIVTELTPLANTTDKKERVAKLTRYVALRQELTELQIKGLQENTAEINSEIEKVVQQINSLFDEK